MGLIRKSLSLTTLGAVDMRSDKERTAAYTKGARREAQKQTKIMQQQAREQAQFQQAQLAAQLQAQQPADVRPMPEQPVLPPPSAEREALLARLAELDANPGSEPPAEKARVAALPYKERVAEAVEAKHQRQALEREQKIQEAAEKTARYAETESRDRSGLSRLEQLQSDPDASLRENLAEISSKGRQQRAEDKAKRVAGREAKAAGRQEKKAARKADKATPQAAAQVFPEGWYADGQDETIVRWYDGTKWTGATRPREQ